MDALSLQKLLSWLSPSFPVGAFAWSSGLEAMAQSERISNSESLRTWLEAGLRHGIWHNDAILLCAAFRGNEIREVNNLALALCAGRERYDETIALPNFAPCLMIGKLLTSLKTCPSPFGSL